MPLFRLGFSDLTETPRPATSLTGLPVVWDDIFGYDPILRRYVIVDFLIPGLSYWVFIEDTVEFSLP